MAREGALWKDSSVLNFGERLKNITAEELHEKKVVYHEKCSSHFAEN